MVPLVADFVTQLGRGSDDGELMTYLRDKLADPEVLAEEFADLPATIAAAESDQRETEAWMRGAFKQFPMNMETFPHSAHVDPRAHAALASLTVAQRLGLYLPFELGKMRAEARISAEWQARECLRFRLYAALLTSAAQQMADEVVTPADFIRRCQSGAQQLGAMTFEAPGRSEE